MKKWILFFVIATFVLSLVSVSTGCKKKSAVAPVDVATATVTSTPSPQATKELMDDFEDADTDMVFWQNLRGGSMVPSADAFGSAISVTADNSGGQSGLYCMKITANLVGLDGQTPAQWAWTSNAMDISHTAGGVDFTVPPYSTYTGIRLKMKGSLGTGTGADTWFLIQWPSTQQLNDVKYRTQWIPTASWTTVSIPFSTFTVAGWAQGGASDVPRATYFTGIRALEFSIAAGALPVNTTGATWFIDDIAFY
jgi:hypothetical protein